MKRINSVLVSSVGQQLGFYCKLSLDLIIYCFFSFFILALLSHSISLYLLSRTNINWTSLLSSSVTENQFLYILLFWSRQKYAALCSKLIKLSSYWHLEPSLRLGLVWIQPFLLPLVSELLYPFSITFLLVTSIKYIRLFSLLCWGSSVYVCI